MRKIVIIVSSFVLLSSINLFGQEVKPTKTNQDSVTHKKEKSTRIRLGKLFDVNIINDGDDLIVRRKKISESHKEGYDEILSESSENEKGKCRKYTFNPNWQGLTIGINNYSGKDFSDIPTDAEFLKLNTNKAVQVNLNLLQVGLPIIKNNLGLVTGIGFQFNHYTFRNTQMRLHTDSSYIYHTIDAEAKTVKNKLKVFYATVPLLLECSFSVGKYSERLYFSAGVEGGLKMVAYTKIKNEDKSKTKSKNDFHLMPYTVNSIIRMGYDSFGIYASYSLLPLFQNNEGPELYPYSIGFTYNF